MNIPDFRTSYLLNRRGFISSMGAAGLSAALSPPAVLRAAQVGQKIRLGIIGCGGRGRFIGDLAREHGGYEIVSLHDYFQNQVDDLGNHFKVPAARRFTGLHGYKRLLDAGGIDAVAVMSPPCFHPEQTAAAVQAGLHVYLAKPVAVDSPGVATIAACGKRSTQNRRCLLIDFQTRAFPHYHEAARRVADGDLGKPGLCEVEATCGAFGLRMPPDSREAMLRNWLQYRELAGESIVEFSIHALDMASLMIGRLPRKASGFGGRRCIDTPVGNCLDTFMVHYTYDNELNLALRAKRFDTYGTRNTSGLYMFLYGEQGCLEAHYNGTVNIRGEKTFMGSKFLGQDFNGIYRVGAVRNLKTFYDNILNDRYDNPTVSPSVQSHYLALLGREAVYRNGETVSWEEVVNSRERLELDQTGLKV